MDKEPTEILSFKLLTSRVRIFSNTVDLRKSKPPLHFVGGAGGGENLFG
jgi:hypothetical protein